MSLFREFNGSLLFLSLFQMTILLRVILFPIRILLLQNHQRVELFSRRLYPLDNLHIRLCRAHYIFFFFLRGIQHRGGGPPLLFPNSIKMRILTDIYRCPRQKSNYFENFTMRSQSSQVSPYRLWALLHNKIMDNQELMSISY